MKLNIYDYNKTKAIKYYYNFIQIYWELKKTKFPKVMNDAIKIILSAAPKDVLYI